MTETDKNHILDLVSNLENSSNHLVDMMIELDKSVDKLFSKIIDPKTPLNLGVLRASTAGIIFDVVYTLGGPDAIEKLLIGGTKDD